MGEGGEEIPVSRWLHTKESQSASFIHQFQQITFTTKNPNDPSWKIWNPKALVRKLDISWESAPLVYGSIPHSGSTMFKPVIPKLCAEVPWGPQQTHGSTGEYFVVWSNAWQPLNMAQTTSSELFLLAALDCAAFLSMTSYPSLQSRVWGFSDTKHMKCENQCETGNEGVDVQTDARIREAE